MWRKQRLFTKPFQVAVIILFEINFFTTMLINGCCSTSVNCFKGTRRGERVVIRRGQLKGAYLKLVANVTLVSVLTRLKV